MNSESEEVKAAFSRIKEAERALQKAMDNFRLSVLVERYLTGNEVCDYLLISPRTLQTLRDTRQIPYTVISGRVFLYPEAGIREIQYKNFRQIEDPF